jgi:protein dithiol oxidoreductase (disulfide-forming)
MLSRLLIALIIMCGVNVAATESTANKSIPDKAFIEGKHYTILKKPVAQADIPIIEFMYFGCKVCFQMVHDIADWSQKTGIGIALVPAHSETVMVQEARMFHTFEQMDVMADMYEEGYIIFQTNLSDLQGADRVNEVLDRKGINKIEFWQVWESPAVTQRLESSKQLTQQVQVAKTPTFLVHGIYKVDVESLKSVDELFELLSFLVAKKPYKAPMLLRKID